LLTILLQSAKLHSGKRFSALAFIVPLLAGLPMISLC